MKTACDIRRVASHAYLLVEQITRTVRVVDLLIFSAVSASRKYFTLVLGLNYGTVKYRSRRTFRFISTPMGCCLLVVTDVIISASLAIKAEQSAHVIEMSSTRVCPHM